MTLVEHRFTMLARFFIRILFLTFPVFGYKRYKPEIDKAEAASFDLDHELQAEHSLLVCPNADLGRNSHCSARSVDQRVLVRIDGPLWYLKGLQQLRILAELDSR